MDNKIPGFFKRLKPNRAVYITAVTLLVALAVIIAITVAANRAKKRPGETTGPNIYETTKAPVTNRPAETTKAPTAHVTTAAPSNVTPDETSAAANAGDTVLTLVLPCSGTLCAYHDEDLQVWSITMRDYRVHLGIDIETEANAPVYAAADGVISEVKYDVKMGYCISVKHGTDTYTIYKNLGETAAEGIAEGVSVRAGQLIGFVGESAMVEIAEGPHLHLEMTVAGTQVNPLEYFDQTAIASLTVDQKYEG